MKLRKLWTSIIMIDDIVIELRKSRLALNVIDRKISFIQNNILFEIEKFNDIYSISVDGYLKEFSHCKYFKFGGFEKILFFDDYYVVETVLMWN